MNDTSPHMTVKMRDMILKKPAEERLRMGCSMYDFSKRLVITGILREHPNLPLERLRGEIFLRFYKNDFDAPQLNKIIAHLRRDLSKRDASS